MPPTVTDNPEQGRFEITLDGEVVGFVTYRRRPDSIAFIHTEIDPAHGGGGLGALLVRAALDASRADGLAVLPFCPFVRDYIAAHPDYLDLVPAGRRAGFGLPDA